MIIFIMTLMAVYDAEAYDTPTPPKCIIDVGKKICVQ